VNIALLSVGTEILLGDTVNTNLASLGQALYNNGFILSTEKTVADDKKLIQDAVNELLENNDVIITCGGIGPTEDDFTKEVISEMFDLKLVVDEDHLSWMKSRWESRGMTMPATNVKQAEIPAGATKLNNTNGTSPGIYIELKSKHVFILPGPPREFIPLVTDELVPFLKHNFTKVEKDYEFILFFNEAESALAEKIDKFKPEGLDIAYLASKGIIKLRIDKNSVSEDALKDFKNQIKETLSDNVLSYENIPASKVLLRELKAKNYTISLVESITGGSFSKELVSHPGVSETLIASNVLYSMDAKKELLNAEPNEDWVLLTEELAVASMKKYNSSVGLAVLGEAGPVPSSKYKIGEIFISICINGEISNFTHNLRGNREDIINRAVNNCIWDLLNLIK
jgi:nicotinamide-nucleotide amidase